MEDGEGSGVGKLGGRRGEEEGFGEFDAIGDEVMLSGLTWRAPHIRPIFGHDMRGAGQFGHLRPV